MPILHNYIQTHSHIIQFAQPHYITHQTIQVRDSFSPCFWLPSNWIYVAEISSPGVKNMGGHNGMALRPRWAAPNAILPYIPASLASLSLPGSSGHPGTFKNVGYPHELGRDHSNGGEGEDEGDGEGDEGEGEEGDGDNIDDNDNIVVSTIAIAVIAGEAEEGMGKEGRQ